MTETSEGIVKDVTSIESVVDIIKGLVGAKIKDSCIVVEYWDNSMRTFSGQKTSDLLRELNEVKKRRGIVKIHILVKTEGQEYIAAKLNYILLLDLDSMKLIKYDVNVSFPIEEHFIECFGGS